MRAWSVFVLPFLLIGCRSEPPAPESSVPLARPADETVAARVADATARLDSTEAGRLIVAAIEAHGGLERWYSNGPLHFRYRYGLGDEPLDTEQTVDTWSSRAIHTLMSDTTVSFGWTGSEAWVMPAGAELPTNARFWSLTPYYFVAMPFVLADPGVILAMADPMAVADTTYDLVHVTFEPGTGDAPDDYYYVMLDPQTGKVRGVRYAVSYPGFFPEGGASLETIMFYDGEKTVGGITFQEGFRSYAWTNGEPGEAKSAGSMSEVRFEPSMPDSLFAMPHSAGLQAEM